MNILISYRGIPLSRGWETGSCLRRALKRFGHRVQPFGNYFNTHEMLEFNGEDSFELHETELLIWLECNDSDPQYIDLLSQVKHCPRVMWDFDSSMHPHFTKALAEEFDFSFIANKNFVDQIPRATYLPYAVDESLFFPVQVKREGVAIIGTAFPPRVDFAERAGVELKTNIFNFAYVEALRRLKIHVHYLASGGKGLIVCRPFETMGCGTMLLAEKCDSLGELFVDGKHFVSFVDAADCRQKVDYYLSHEEERETIAKAGFEETITKHSYIARAKTILDKVQK